MPKKFILITVIFIVLTAIFSYPFVLQMNSSIMGSHSTDEPFAALWHAWWYKYAHLHHLDDSNYSTIAVPFGIDTGKKTASPAWDLFYKCLSITTDPVITFNFIIILSFVLSGITMYYLVFYSTGRSIPSFFAASIYAFCPYHFARAWQHLGLAQIQWMPLYLLTLFRLKKRVDSRNIFLSVFAILLVNSFELHYAIFMYIATVVFVLYHAVFYKKMEVRLLGALSIVMGIGIILVLSTCAGGSLKNMLFGRSTIQPSVWSLVRPFEDLFAQSARPLSYFLPATEHPIFGKFTQRFVGSSLYGISFTEHILYLGWTAFILAIFAFRRWRRMLKVRNIQYSNDENFSFGFFVFLAIVGWLFSQPPWWNIFGFKLFMPSFFMYKILPIIRAYCRFGIVVMLAVSVLAGFGLKFIQERFRSQKTKIALTCLFLGLVFFEFWNWPPYRIIGVSKVPAVYYWFKEEPGDFIIADYPLDTNGANLMYMFYQTKHEKKIINGTIPGTFANLVTKTITGLSEPKTAGVLKWMGVKYVLVHREDYLRTELIEDGEELDKISSNSGLKFIRSFSAQECPPKNIMCTQESGPIDVYEVIADAVEPKI